MTRILAFWTAIALVGYSSASQADSSTCSIIFHLGTTSSVETMSFDVDYEDAVGEFPGTHVTTCQTINTFGLVSPYDFEDPRLVRIQMIVPSTVKGPKDFLKCTWVTSSEFPVADDFSVTNQSAEDQGSNMINPNVTISNIECSVDPTTTTTTTTTTTLSTTSTSTTTTTTSTTTSTTMQDQLCGDFDGNDKVLTSDALNVLRASVGSVECAPCVCDIDGNGVTAATDALFALKYAVGQPIPLNCSPCS